jgi:hypothetical protein
MSWNYANAELFLSGEKRLVMDGHVWFDTGNGVEEDQPDERSIEVYSPESLNLPGEHILTIRYNIHTRVVLDVSEAIWTPPQAGEVAGDWDGGDYQKMPQITIRGEIPIDE